MTIEACYQNVVTLVQVGLKDISDVDLMAVAEGMCRLNKQDQGSVTALA